MELLEEGLRVKPGLREHRVHGFLDGQRREVAAWRDGEPQVRGARKLDQEILLLEVPLPDSLREVGYSRGREQCEEGGLEELRELGPARGEPGAGKKTRDDLAESVHLLEEVTLEVELEEEFPRGPAEHQLLEEFLAPVRDEAEAGTEDERQHLVHVRETRERKEATVQRPQLPLALLEHLDRREHFPLS